MCPKVIVTLLFGLAWLDSLVLIQQKLSFGFLLGGNIQYSRQYVLYTHDLLGRKGICAQHDSFISNPNVK